LIATSQLKEKADVVLEKLISVVCDQWPVAIRRRRVTHNPNLQKEGEHAESQIFS